MHESDRYVLVHESADSVPLCVRPMSDLAEAKLQLRSIPDEERCSWYILDLLERRKVGLEGE